MRQATRTRKELKGDPGHEKAVDDIPLEAHSKGGMSDVRRGEGPSWEFQGVSVDRGSRKWLQMGHVDSLDRHVLRQATGSAGTGTDLSL